MTGAQIERERTKKRLLELARLSRDDYQEWKLKLQGLDMSRESIKQAMGFAYDKIESAEEVYTYISFLSSKMLMTATVLNFVLIYIYILLH